MKAMGRLTAEGVGKRSAIALQVGIVTVVMLVAVTSQAMTCDVATSSAAFGTYDPLVQQYRDTATTITVTCSSLVSLFVSYSIAIMPGSGTFPNRVMLSGANRLQYNLYADVARTQVLGDGTGGTVVLADNYVLQVVVPVVRTYTVYGRIPAGQQAAHAGFYMDTPMVVLDYHGILI